MYLFLNLVESCFCLSNGGMEWKRVRENKLSHLEDPGILFSLSGVFTRECSSFLYLPPIPLWVKSSIGVNWTEIAHLKHYLSHCCFEEN